MTYTTGQTRTWDFHGIKGFQFHNCGSPGHNKTSWASLLSLEVCEQRLDSSSEFEALHEELDKTICVPSVTVQQDVYLVVFGANVQILIKLGQKPGS